MSQLYAHLSGFRLQLVNNAKKRAPGEDQIVTEMTYRALAIIVTSALRAYFIYFALS
jgi:hypothetical protein